MAKLKKEDFNKQFRFREARTNNSRGGLVNRVNCVSCVNTTCEPRPMRRKDDDPDGIDNFCNHQERLTRIKIAEYWRGWSRGNSHNLANVRVCDAYTSQPLPDGISLPIIPEGHAILLGSQYADPFHADSTCPYVIEEARMIATNGTGIIKGAEIRVVDILDMVPGESIRDICEMPCCESKLPYQIMASPDNYRKRAGIKPDGTEPIIWVRRVKDHKRKFNMDIEEAEAALDLTRFSGPKFKTIHDEIVEASNHLYNTCNLLGSKPLSEVANPVVVHPANYRLLEQLSSEWNKPEFWMYDERLFDGKNKPNVPIRSLEVIPEGFILCVDTEKVIRFAKGEYHRSILPEGHLMYGIVKPLSDESLIRRGVTHFVDIRAISCHDSNHWWGVYGKRFSKLACFDQE